MNIRKWSAVIALVGLFVSFGFLSFVHRSEPEVDKFPEYLTKKIDTSSLPNNEAYQKKRENIEAKIAWATKHQKRTLLANALGQFAELENKFGGSADVIREKLAKANEILGDNQSAVKAKVLLVSGMFKLGQLGKYDEAISDLSASAQLANLHREDRTHSLALAFLARAFYFAKQTQDAITSAHKAIKVAELCGCETALIQALFESCRIYSAENLFSEGAPFARRLLELMPDDEVAHELLFWHNQSLDSSKKYAAALNKKIERLSAEPNKSRSNLQQLALSYMKLSSIEAAYARYESAIKLANEAIRYAESSNSPGIISHVKLRLTDHYMDKGESDKACKLFVEITKNDKDFDLIGVHTDERVMYFCNESGV